MLFVLLIIGVGLIAYGLYKLLTTKLDYFEKRGLKYLKPFPFNGKISSLFNKQTVLDMIDETYYTFPDQKIIGVYELSNPIYLLRDPAVAKQLAIKEFDHFTDRRVIPMFEDEIFLNNLTTMKGQRWREMRAALSPAFTGSKMRLMFTLVAECCQQLVETLKEEVSKVNGDPAYDIKDIISRYTNDVIASCAFGLKLDSIKDPKNDFYLLGQSFSNFNKWLLVKFTIIRYMPKIAKFFQIKMFDNQYLAIFKQIIVDQMRTRKEKNIVRPDMINILMQLKEGGLEGSEEAKTHWTDGELIAQSFLFFLAGFETTSTYVQFLIYELTINPDIQNRLIEEIDGTGEKAPTPTYESINQMKYLDMVVSEGLRKWTPGFLTERQCVKDYHYTDSDGLDFVIEKDRVIQIPIYSYHHDPIYFPDPDKFDPERFSDTNKDTINFDAYLPFGIGPRNCIGLRFALMEIKVLLYYILSDFTLEVCSETPVPIKLKKFMGLIPEKKIKVAFRPRSQ